METENQNSTEPSGSVDLYMNGISDPQRKADCSRIHQMMQQITGEPGRMWRSSIVGYGTYHYIYESGREGDWMLTGFSNRKNAISLYIMAGFDKYEQLMQQLGKYKTGKSCLYIKSLSDIDEEILHELIASSVKEIKEKYKNTR